MKRLSKNGIYDVVKVGGGERIIDVAYFMGYGSMSYLKRLFKEGAVKDMETGEIIKDYETII